MDIMRIDDLNCYASCLFMGKLYILGGEVCTRKYDCQTDECYVYDPDKNRIECVSGMQRSRCCHSCVVYGGKIVVIGGISGTINSVESYDHFEDKWMYMPDLIEEKIGNESVAMGNKFYVIGYNKNKTRNCEVFDNISNKFILIKQPPIVLFERFRETFRVKNEIIVTCSVDKDDKGDNVYIYNTSSDEWTSMCVQVFKETKFSSIIYKC